MGQVFQRLWAELRRDALLERLVECLGPTLIDTPLEPVHDEHVVVELVGQHPDPGGTHLVAAVAPATRQRFTERVISDFDAIVEDQQDSPGSYAEDASLTRSSARSSRAPFDLTRT